MFRNIYICTQLLRDRCHAFWLLPNRLLHDIDVRAVLRHSALVLDVAERSSPAGVTLFGLCVQLTLQTQLQRRQILQLSTKVDTDLRSNVNCSICGLKYLHE